MADQKFTDLAAVTPPINASSLVAFSTYDGVSAYTSEKVTLTQLRDAVYLMEAEDKITFDSSGTNKTVLSDSNSGANITFNNDGKDDIYLTTDGTGFSEAYVGVYNDAGNFGFELLADAGVSYIYGNDTGVGISISATDRIKANATGLGFFNTTPAAQPTGVAVTASGIHAALVTLGLITA